MLLYLFYTSDLAVFIFIIGFIMDYIDYTLCTNREKKHEGTNPHNKGLVLSTIHSHKVPWTHGNFRCNRAHMSTGYDYH